MSIVEIEDVYYAYQGGEYALSGVSLNIEQGEFVAVLGRNGSGKSTLAKMINGLLLPKRGKVTVKGMDTKDRDSAYEIRKVAGMVFQNPDNQMIASIVEDDIAFGPENLGLDREEIGRRIDFALGAVGMSAFRRSTPTRLSGGQKQRIAIAGVLALKPEILILDESTAMLDPRGRQEVMEVALKMNKEEKMTVILITHYMDEATEADRVFVMDRGKIAINGTPKQIFQNEDEVQKLGLSLPRAVKFSRKLRAAGLNLDQDILSKEELRDNLCALLRKN